MNRLLALIRPFAVLVAALPIALPVAQAFAHEFWIEPSKFHPEVGGFVGVHLRVGDGFPGEARPRDPNKLVRLFAIGPASEIEVSGRDGSDPAGEFPCKESGVYVIGYRSNHTILTQEAAKFESYLQEEGLDHVVAARSKAGEAGTAGRERFSRAAKCLVRTAGSAELSAPQIKQSERVLGFPAEVTPHGMDPTTSKVGERLTFKITHEGVPAADVLVLAMSKMNPGHVIKARSNEAGVVEFTPDGPGLWMVSNILMKRAEASSGVDWESVWASLTFEVAAVESGEQAGAKVGASASKGSGPAVDEEKQKQ